MGSLTRRGAGVAEAVWNLALAQSRLAREPGAVRILGLEDGGARFDLPVEACGVRAFGPTPPGWVPGLAGKIFDQLRDGDVLHSHGHWLHANWAAYAAARRAGKRVRLVISPHGMLGPEPMRHSPVRKKIALALFERRALNEAHCVIAASEREAAELEALGVRAPIVQVPFGIWPEEYAATGAVAEDNWAELHRTHPAIRRGKYALFLGRLAAIKAPLDLLEAWSGHRELHGEYQVVFAGPDCGERTAMEAMIRERGLEGSVILTGPVSGAIKKALLRESRLLVLCSRYESFGLVVLESLVSGRPVLVSEETPWRSLEAEGCGWVHNRGVAGLGRALGQALVGGARGVNAREVTSRYAWPIIAQRIAEAVR